MPLPPGTRIEVWRELGHPRSDAAIARLRGAFDADALTERGAGSPTVVVLLVTEGLGAPDLTELGDADAAIVPAWLGGDWARVAPDELREATPIDLRSDDEAAWQALLDATSNAANLAGL